jgi:hypothetical protein
VRVIAGLTREEFDQAAQEIRDRWQAAGTRDEGFRVIAEMGRKYGYKNVIAAIEGRVPKQFTRERGVDEWIEDRRQEEAGT